MNTYVVFNDHFVASWISQTPTILGTTTKSYTRNKAKVDSYQSPIVKKWLYIKA
jgi:hypothetical protein